MKKLMKITANVLSASILVQSCTNDSFFSDDSADEINQKGIKSNPTKATVVMLDTVFDESTTNYTDFLLRLSNDIVNNPVIAKAFSQDPEAFIEAYGIKNMKIDLDDELLQLITALGDEDIVAAIKKNDIKEYLSLCKSKGYFDRISALECNSSLIKTLGDKINLSKASQAANDSIDTSAVAVVVAVAVGVAAVIWVTAITHIGTVNVATAATAINVVAAINTVTVTSGETAKTKEIKNMLNSKVLKIWNIKNEDDKTLYLVADEYKKQLANQCVDAIKQVYPGIYEKYGEAYLKNNILINIE